LGCCAFRRTPGLRPTMSNVVLMLISGEFARLKTVASGSEFSLAMKTDTTKTQSVNEVSISMIEPR
jgi:hypothetical protein